MVIIDEEPLVPHLTVKDPSYFSSYMDTIFEIFFLSNLFLKNNIS